MTQLLIKNGIVYDPLNGIIGEKIDIAVKDGKIAKEIKDNDVKVIDVSNKLVYPGGIDPHSHVAGPKVNVGRLFRPEDHRAMIFPKTKNLRAGVGLSVPSTSMTGYVYARMGYTTVMEPAMPPLMAKHTHEEITATPILDEGAYTLMGNNWIIMTYLLNKEIEKCAVYVAWLLRATKGFAIKLVNPGGTEAWGWAKNVMNIDDTVPYFNITPAEIIKGLAQVNEMLGLPSSIHVHPNSLGHPGNYSVTLKTFDLTKAIGPNPKFGDREQAFHCAHAQFHSYGGDRWLNFESKAKEVSNYINQQKNLTIDLGAIIFGNTTTMTADGPLEYDLHKITKFKWANADIEVETGSGVVPFTYSPKSAVNSIQWAIGLELALLIKNPWQVYLSTDHPNAGPFHRYPLVISWLMSKKARNELIKRINPAVRQRAVLPTLEREYSFEDIAILTRAGPAKALGLTKNKGHLGEGADADIAIYDINPKEIDPSSKPEQIIKAFYKTLYTIKDGQIVVDHGEVVQAPPGKTLWVNVKTDQKLEKEVLDEVERWFKRYYTVNLNNYLVNMEYLPKPFEIRIDATEFR